MLIYPKKKEKAFGSDTPYRIFVDQVGYLPDSRKIAVLPFPAELFAIIDENGDKLYEGEVRSFGHDECSGDDVYLADFSDFRRNGTYRVSVGGKTSTRFRIGESVYRKLFCDVSKAYYYTRCGHGLDERFAGKFAHKRCHTELAESLEDGTMLDIKGGWHDAGDYGRYVTAGCCACAQLLYAYKFFPEVFAKLNVNIPESGSGIPDILSECRWELEWLLKMQRADGAAYHKATTMRHAPFIMPEADKSKMYVFTVSSSATADLCAVCALASGIFRDFDQTFSNRLRKAAERGYHWLEEHPEFVGFFNPAGCDTGLYAEEGDIDNRYWAAAEMFALTGDAKYNNHFNALFSSPYFDGRSYIKTSLGHNMIGGLGSLAYVLCDRPGKSKEVVSFLNELFTGEAYWLRDKAKKCGYASTLEDWEYYWGSNMSLLHSGMKFILANLMTGREEFYEYALEQLHVLLGKNTLGMCYVTGTGEYSPVRPHYRPSAADKIDEPVPGFVIGGPNRELSDPFAKDIIPVGTPPMKCYIDDERCYSLNEITIYWNSPAIFLLAGIEHHEALKNKDE